PSFPPEIAPLPHLAASAPSQPLTLIAPLSVCAFTGPAWRGGWIEPLPDLRAARPPPASTRLSPGAAPLGLGVGLGPVSGIVMVRLADSFGSRLPGHLTPTWSVPSACRSA